jgi:signal transduction histidine kinase/DNA-binding response OmpR family regulator
MEDDPGLARLLQKKLERAGYVVDIAQDGAEGLAMYDAGVYDVMAVDQSIPVREGLDVIRTLAARGPLPPTIMVTGTGNERIAAEALKLGARDYIVKDGERGYLDSLPTAIEQVLRQQHLEEERRRTEAALRKRNKELALLNQLGQELTATLDLEKLNEHLLEAVTRTLGAEGASIWLWTEEEEDWLVCWAASHHGRGRSPLNFRLRPEHSIASWVVQSGKSTIVSNVQDDPRFFSGVDEQTGFRTTSLLAVPLLVRDKVIGVLEVVNKLKSDFDADDLALIRTLAASAAIAIDNARLVEVQRQYTAKLQARNEELDAFAHTVAHDLKHPLGLMIGFAEALEENCDTITVEELRRHLCTVARTGRKMRDIFNELLLLAGVREAKVEIEPLDMAHIVAQVRRRLAYLIKEHQAHVVLPPRETWPVALGYGPWIEEVWVNYVNNAIKYGGQPPRVELGFGESAALVSEPAQTRSFADSQIRFWVRDNGAGLASEEQARLFTPFTRLSSHAQRVEGHGLGLSIARRIVERLGGQVGVKSQVGAGSTFWFTLPLRLTRQKADDGHAGQGQDGTTAKGDAQAHQIGQPAHQHWDHCADDKTNAHVEAVGRSRMAAGVILDHRQHHGSGGKDGQTHQQQDRQDQQALDD